MSRNSFIRMVVLSCVALVAACDGDGLRADRSKDTEINLVISDPATAAEQLALLIDFVSYRISCPASGLTPYDDSVAITGQFETNLDETPAVWTSVSDLPLTFCTIALWVFYEDEVVCSGSQALAVVPGDDPSAPSKANIALECSLSVIPPSGDVDIDGTFSLVHGNYCPQLFWLGAFPSAADPTVMNVQTSYMDLDSTCGQNCDPQTCDFTVNPPVCSPAPDPGLSSTLLDPADNGSFGDINAVDTTYACDPLLPGPTEICVRVSDGDIDCDQVRCITIECPDLCEGVVCDDGIECTRDLCNPLDGSCSNDPAPDGLACSSCDGTCQAGVCDLGLPFTADQNSTVMNFLGSLQAYSATLVNPYSGRSTSVSGTYNLNTSSYKGVGGVGVIIGTNLGDVLLVQDPVGTQRVCGVNEIIAVNGFDVMFLADSYVVLGDMTISGGNSNDILWANVGDDTVYGQHGDDLIDGGPGDDTIDGGNGDDTITLWPGSGFDSISGGLSVDRVEIDAIQSQILISAAADPSYEFDIFYLGIPMAQIGQVELLLLNDTFIDLATCTGGAGDVCNLCGNDALNGGEECDDGNNVDGDGCTANCTAEY